MGDLVITINDNGQKRPAYLDDDETGRELALYKWHTSQKRNHLLRRVRIRRVDPTTGEQVRINAVVYLAREVLGLPAKHHMVEYIDGDKLNCRRSNLRVGRRKTSPPNAPETDHEGRLRAIEQMRQTFIKRPTDPASPSYSSYRGVWQQVGSSGQGTGTYSAQVGKFKLGSFRKEQEAARARDKVLIMNYGPEAKDLMNFPEDFEQYIVKYNRRNPAPPAERG
jgi:hypothetical protein